MLELAFFLFTAGSSENHDKLLRLNETDSVHTDDLKTSIEIQINKRRLYLNNHI